MLKVENIVLPSTEQWKACIHGMRNPMNSWDRSDSYDAVDCKKCGKVEREGICKKEDRDCTGFECYALGNNDLNLMQRLFKGGTEHRKYLRMLPVYMDITAPLYWWKEFDTYKVGTVTNSCSTMHKLTYKPFTLDDFSNENLESIWLDELNQVIDKLNVARDGYLKAMKDSNPLVSPKDYWWQMIQLLPSSYNQKRTVMMNYEVAVNIIRQRTGHKLNEWHTLVDALKELPYMKEIME